MPNMAFSLVRNTCNYIQNIHTINTLKVYRKVRSPGVRDEGVVLPGGGRGPHGHGEHPGHADGVRRRHGEDVLHEEGVELDDL